MSLNKIYWKHVFALAALLATQPAFAAEPLADSAAVEIGTGAKVQLIRFSAQKDWQKSWFERQDYHLSGYWDLNLAQWRGNAHMNISGQKQNMTVVGLTPVFRYERRDKRGWFAEAGIGPSFFSELYNNDDNRLSTSFEFADHLGGGYVLDNKWELSARLQHYSNGGIKQPNSGVNLFLVKAAYRF
jgi:hypothetical protein